MCAYRRRCHAAWAGWTRGRWPTNAGLRSVAKCRARGAAERVLWYSPSFLDSSNLQTPLSYHHHSGHPECAQASNELCCMALSSRLRAGYPRRMGRGEWEELQYWSCRCKSDRCYSILGRDEASGLPCLPSFRLSTGRTTPFFLLASKHQNLHQHQHHPIPSSPTCSVIPFFHRPLSPITRFCTTPKLALQLFAHPDSRNLLTSQSLVII